MDLEPATTDAVDGIGGAPEDALLALVLRGAEEVEARIVQQLAADLGHHVLVREDRGHVFDDAEGLGVGVLCDGLGDEPLVEHVGDDVVAPVEHELGIAAWVVLARVAGKHGDGGGLGDGELVELGNLVDIETGAAPAEITRRDRRRSVTISGSLTTADLGAAIAEAEQIAAEILPEGVNFGLSGEAEAFRESFAELFFAIVLAILIIYMVLAAQFESLVHPLTVMLALPLAMVGALGALYVLSFSGMSGMSLNLFSMIGVVLLFGLVTKNSILLVDYTNQLRESGEDTRTAILEAGRTRLRPILMTAVSTIFGILPIAIGLGPGAEGRRPLGVAVVAGMTTSTVLTLFVVPVVYSMVDDVRVRIRRRREQRRKLAGKPAEAGGERPAPADVANH